MKLRIDIQRTYVSEAGWFEDLSKAARAAYIKKHPNSVYAKKVASHAEEMKKPFRIGGQSGGTGEANILNAHYKSDGHSPSAKEHIDYHDHHAANHKDAKEAKKHKKASKLVHKITKEGSVTHSSKHRDAVDTLSKHHDKVVEFHKGKK